MVVLIVLNKFAAEFSVSAPVVNKIPSLMGPEILYTTGAGKGVKVSVASFPPEVVVQIVSQIFLTQTGIY